MKKILFLICIPVIIFTLLERNNISLFVAAKLQDMAYYIGQNEAIMKYNEAVLLAQDSQYSEAKSLLQFILNNEQLAQPADVYELYGDLVYQTRGSTGDVAVFYNRSLEYLDSERVREKIKLLDIIPQKSQDEKTVASTGSTDTPEDLTGAMLREQRRQEIVQDGQSPWSIRDTSAGMIEPQDIISRTLDIFHTGSAIPKDW